MQEVLPISHPERRQDRTWEGEEEEEEEQEEDLKGSTVIRPFTDPRFQFKEIKRRK